MNLQNKVTPRVLQSLETVDETVLNKDLIKHLVLHIISSTSTRSEALSGLQSRGDNASKMSDEASGAILIFVDGLSSIRDVIETLKGSPELRSQVSPYSGTCLYSLIILGDNKVVTLIFIYNYFASLFFDYLRLISYLQFLTLDLFTVV